MRLKKLFSKKAAKPRIDETNVIQHLSEKFSISQDAMNITFEADKKGNGGDKGRGLADSYIIRLKQPTDRPNLHHDMHEELKRVFNPTTHSALKRTYFGVCEDKDYKHEQWKLRDKPKAAIPEQPSADI